MITVTMYKAEKMDSPIANKLRRELPTVEFTEYWLDTHQQKFYDGGITRTPTIIVEDDGQIVEVVHGYIEFKELKKKIETYMKHNSR